LNRLLVKEIYLGVFFLTLLSGCTSSHNVAAVKTEKIGPTFMLYSPNGEPLNGGALGRPFCEQALSAWFKRVNTSQSGFINHDEFMADAAIQFQRMDIDKNGYLLPEEIERYRRPYRQDLTDVKQSSSSNSKHPNPSYQNAQPDPVMSADTNNDFRVSPQEFTSQAENIFKLFDKKDQGHVSFNEFLKECPPKETD